VHPSYIPRGELRPRPSHISNLFCGQGSRRKKPNAIAADATCNGAFGRWRRYPGAMRAGAAFQTRWKGVGLSGRHPSAWTQSRDTLCLTLRPGRLSWPLRCAGGVDCFGARTPGKVRFSGWAWRFQLAEADLFSIQNRTYGVILLMFQSRDVHLTRSASATLYSSHVGATGAWITRELSR
jgi:hypothetical protein